MYLSHDRQSDLSHNHFSGTEQICSQSETLPTSELPQLFIVNFFKEILKVIFGFVQHIFTRPGHILTVHFLQMKTDRNDSAVIEVYDGISKEEKLLARVSVRNETLPQSISTSGQNLFVKFTAEPRTQMVAFFRITSGYSKFLIDKNLSFIIIN